MTISQNDKEREVWKAFCEELATLPEWAFRDTSPHAVAKEAMARMLAEESGS